MPENGQLAFAKVVGGSSTSTPPSSWTLSIPMNNKMVMWEIRTTC